MSNKFFFFLFIIKDVTYTVIRINLESNNNHIKTLTDIYIYIYYNEIYTFAHYLI